MKKFILLTGLILIFAVSLFAQAPSKTLTQEIKLTVGQAGSIFDYVTAASPAHTANYFLSVYSPNQGLTRSTLTHPASIIRVCKTGTGANVKAVASINQSSFPSAWATGEVLVLTLTYIPTGETLTRNVTVPSGGSWSQINENAWVGVPPFPVAPSDTWNYNLSFNVPAGAYTINGVGAPYLFTDADGLEPNTLIGNYTISAAPAGFHWVENPIAVAAGDFILAGKADYIYNASKTFVLEADPVTDIPLDPSGTIPAPVGVVIVPIDPATDNVPAEIFGIDILLAAHRYMITFTGIHDVVVYKPAEYLNEWWTWIVVGGVVVPAIPNPLGAAVPSYTFPNVNFDAKGDVKVYINDNEVLPVEFSSFAATLTAQNFVKLTWVTETETGVSGYNVYRSESADQASAVKINGTLIDATNTSSTSTYNHVDNAVSPETTYSYWLEVVEMDGTTSFHGPTTVYVETPASIVPSLVTTMGNAYPNPFKANTSTNIAYEVKAGETGTITIYNIIGQVVKTVPVKETTAPATFTWNGRDSKGNVCASGIYFYKMSTPSKNVTKKMVIVN